MREPTLGEIIKVLTWCGFKRNPHNYEGESEYWFAPDGNTLRYLPTIDLNNLFQYAVPKLLEEGWEITISYDQKYKTWDVELNHPEKHSILKQEPALQESLFWAIWEAIHAIEGI